MYYLFVTLRLQSRVQPSQCDAGQTMRRTHHTTAVTTAATIITQATTSCHAILYYINNSATR